MRPYPWTLLILLTACVCNPDLRGSVVPDAYEPNDTVAQAKPLGPGVTAQLDEDKGKLDFWRFNALTGERVRLVPEPVSGRDLAVVLSLYSSQGELLVAPTRRDGPFPTLDYTVPQTGTYVVKVEGYYTGPADSFCSFGNITYTLSLQRNPAAAAPAQGAALVSRPCASGRSRVSAQAAQARLNSSVAFIPPKAKLLESA